MVLATQMPTVFAILDSQAKHAPSENAPIIALVLELARIHDATVPSGTLEMIALSCSVPMIAQQMVTVFVGSVFVIPAGALTTAQFLSASMIAQETDTVSLASVRASKVSLEIRAPSQFALTIVPIMESARPGVVSASRDIHSVCWRTVLRNLVHDVLKVNAKMGSASAEVDGEVLHVMSRLARMTAPLMEDARRVVFASVTMDGAKMIVEPKFVQRDSTRPALSLFAQAMDFATRSRIACVTAGSLGSIALRKYAQITAQVAASALLVVATVPMDTLVMTVPRTLV